MARPLRQDEPGLFYHVMARGNNGDPLFLCDADYQDYLDALVRTMRLFGIEIHGYTLMTNHLHLLLRALNTTLSDSMERLQGWYARRFNWRHGRRGHVFQDRFLSKVVSRLRYLGNLAAYFANNPVNAGLCEHPAAYRYSGYRHYFGRPDGILTRTVIPALFPGGHRQFEAFVTRHEPVDCDAVGWPLAPEWYADLDEMLGAPPAPPQPRSDLVVRVVAESQNIAPLVLVRSHRDRNLGRVKELAALALRDSTTLSLRDIAGALGYESVQAASRAIAKARKRTSEVEVAALLRRIREQSLSG